MWQTIIPMSTLEINPSASHIFTFDKQLWATLHLAGTTLTGLQLGKPSLWQTAFKLICEVM